MNKKWLLINPPTGKYIRDTRCQASVDDVFAIFERTPVDLAYIAGAISSNNDDCLIRDYPVERLEISSIITDLQQYNADYIVINTTIFTYQDDLKICDRIKEINPGIIIIAKGAIFFNESERLMNLYKALDITVSYEEEKAFKELSAGIDLACINNITYRSDVGIIVNQQKLEHDLNIEKPRIDLINHDLYKRPDTNERQATIIVGRGCPGRCIYCLAPIVGGRKARYRSINDIIDEINTYYTKYKIKNFYFSADTFTWNEIWVIELCNRINQLDYKISWLCTSRVDKITDGLMSAMRKSGCWGLSIGIESGNEEIQKLIKKGLTKQQIINAIKICKKYRFVCLLHFIIGFPWDNKETILETIKFAKRLHGNIVEFYIATPVKGSELFGKLNGYYKQRIENKEHLNYVTATMDINNLTREEILQLRKKAIKSIYYDPMFYIRSLLYIKSLKQLLYCIRYILNKLFSIMHKMNTSVNET
ncbi:MAG: hypothetical protein K0R00_254 [Herbinix sp.]|jgi:radical SAM superfamily enzyme YgiQ (UPF0313 family)|nr:hypothetical protein [Herbinix sp.]